jgi:hypothetical protein
MHQNAISSQKYAQLNQSRSRPGQRLIIVGFKFPRHSSGYLSSLIINNLANLNIEFTQVGNIWFFLGQASSRKSAPVVGFGRACFVSLQFPKLRGLIDATD